MNTFAWVLILAAILIARSVYKGRTLNMGEDLSDAFLALINNDSAKLKEVLSRTGDSNTASFADLSIYQNSINAIGGPAVGVAKGVGSALDQLESKANSSVGLAAVILGGRAKGYRWGASGPDYYDCSGLIWAAMKLAKVYSESRFNTASFESYTSKVYRRVSGPPQVDDIVVWPLRVPYATGHMGVVTQPGRFYSARSIRSGIGESAIDGFRSYPPTVYRRYSYPSPDVSNG